MTKPKEEKDASKGKPARRVRLLSFPSFPSPPRVRAALRRLPASFPELKLPMTSATPGEKEGQRSLGVDLGLHYFPSFLAELSTLECLQPPPLPLWTHGGGAAGRRSCCSPERREPRCLLTVGRLSV